MSQDTTCIDGDYPLTADQVEQFQKDGHILLRGAASSQDVAVWRPSITAAVERFNTETRELKDRDTYSKAFLQITNLWQRAPEIRPFVLAKRFGKIASELLGTSGVRLYHDQALFKEGGGGRTPWHQDQYYWPLDNVPTITMWMPLVNIPIDMGALTFASGSHTEGFLGHINISDESEEYFSRFVTEKGYPIVNAAMQAGDATFHTGWTLHCAPANQTTRLREVMTVIYFADGGCVSTPDNPNRQLDMETWLPGLKPGDLAASELNPLIYRK